MRGKQRKSAAPPPSVLELRTARAAGRLAAANGLPLKVCPYKPGPDGAPTPLIEAFVYGYNQAAGRNRGR